MLFRLILLTLLFISSSAENTASQSSVLEGTDGITNSSDIPTFNLTVTWNQDSLDALNDQEAVNGTEEWPQWTDNGTITSTSPILSDTWNISAQTGTSTEFPAVRGELSSQGETVTTNTGTTGLTSGTRWTEKPFRTVRKTGPNRDDWTADIQNRERFEYDYHTLRMWGLLFAATLFIIGILVFCSDNMGMSRCGRCKTRRTYNVSSEM